MVESSDRTCRDYDELDVIQLISAFDHDVSNLSFGAITKSALKFMAERLQIARASIALVRSGVDGFLLFDSTVDVKGVESGRIISSSSASLGQTIAERRVIYRPDLRTWPIRNPVDDAFIAHGFFSTLSVPLVSSGACIGSLNAAASLVDGISPTVRQVIELVAPRLAFALEVGVAHQELAQSEKRFRDIFETVGDGIVVADHTSRRIVMVNGAICRMLGRGASELVGQTIAVLHPSDRLEEVVGIFASMIAGHIADALEIPLCCVDGSVMLTDVSARNTTISNRHCVVGVFRDSGQRMRREEEQIQVQKLESIRTLAAGLAHDFNNLLTGIVGNVSLAQLQMKETDETWQLLNDAQEAATRATALTRQLLTFAKGGAPMRGRVNILQVLRDAVGFATTGSNIQCEFQLPSGRFVVPGDAGQLAQVFQNILRNALDAMPTGGRVQIHATHVEASAGNEICIEICDHGQGISPDIIDKVYSPFFSTKDHHSGLGLAVAYSVIKNHAGRIDTLSELGLGTTIRVTLPLVDESDVPAGTPRPGHAAVRKILIMDDEAIVLSVAERALRRGGFATRTAANGGDAVALYRAAWDAGEPFDAVILDLTIPGGMGGREAAKLILAVNPKARLMVSSGYSEDSVMAEYQAHGFCAVLPKPYGAAQLCETVHAMIQGDRPTPGSDNA